MFKRGKFGEWTFYYDKNFAPVAHKQPRIKTLSVDKHYAWNHWHLDNKAENLTRISCQMRSYGDSGTKNEPCVFPVESM